MDVEAEAADAETSSILFLTALGGKPLGRAKVAPARRVAAYALNLKAISLKP